MVKFAENFSLIAIHPTGAIRLGNMDGNIKQLEKTRNCQTYSQNIIS